MHSFYRGESRPGQDHPDQSLSAADQERQRGVQPRPPTSRPGLQAPAALITDDRSWPKGPPCPCPAGRDETRPRNRKVLREPFPSPQRPGLTQSLPPAQAQSKKNQFQEAAPGLQATFRPDCNSARGGPGPLCPAWGPWAKPEGLASVCRLNCRPPDPSGFPPTLLSPLSLFSPLGGIILKVDLTLLGFPGTAFLTTFKALPQPCARQARHCHFSRIIYSLPVSWPHFGNSRNISNPPQAERL